MTDFVQAAPGTYMGGRDGERLVVAWETDGTPIFAKCETKTSTVIPALPGWFLLTMHCNEDGPWSWRHPIIGWSVKEETLRCGDGTWKVIRSVHPITDDYLDDNDVELSANLRPDGTVSEYCQEWANEEESFEGVSNRAKEKYAQAEARRAGRNVKADA